MLGFLLELIEWLLDDKPSASSVYHYPLDSV